MKAIIIDDEAHCSDRLQQLLHDYCQGEVEILAVCSDVDSGEKAIREKHPDFIFLDIQIHDKTGFDLLKRFDKIDFRVVFTTAFENYALQAIKFAATDYLLKPVDPDDLKVALEKLHKESDRTPEQNSFQLLQENIQNMRSQNRRIAVPTQTQILFIPIDDIMRCESDVNYTYLHLKDKRKILVSRTLKNFEALLAPYNFFRVHNSHLVNLDYVKSYNRGKGGYVVLDDDTPIEVSSRRKDEFLQRLSAI